MAEILKQFEKQVERIVLIPGSGGAFEVTVNGDKVFSKLALGRHAESGEVAAEVRAYLSRSQG